MNKHFSETEIESLALATIKSPDKVGTHIHLSECAMCGEKYEYLVEFYHLLSEELEKPAYLGLTKLVGASKGSETVVLLPFRGKSSPEEMGLTPGLIVLAAQEKSVPEERFTTIATFASDNPNTLLRVVEDRDAHTLTVFVLSEDGTVGKSNEVVAFDALGHSIRATTNDLGFAQMKSEDGIDWTTARVAILRRRSS